MSGRHRRREAPIIENVQIAVVDHDSHTRDFAANVLMYCVNRQIMVFEGAESLIHFLEQGNHLDLLLLNLDLPGHSGPELLKTVRQTYPHIRLVVVSDNPSEQAIAENLGADVFLAQPYTLRDMFRIVQHFVVGQTTDEGRYPEKG